MGKVSLAWADVASRAARVANQIIEVHGKKTVLVYPVPEGGCFAALAIESHVRSFGGSLQFVEHWEEAEICLDDVIDSGATRERFAARHFYALVNKRQEGLSSDWVVFPWEKGGDEEEGPTKNIRRLIEFIGDDPNREGLRETPRRVIRAYQELFSGYEADVSNVITTFEDSCDDMVLVKDIEFYSMCEHHMLPFFGRAHVAYIPDGRVIGVSKLIRLVEIFSRRLQIQERLCREVTGALREYLKPKGAACVLEAIHLCMTSRGVQKQHSKMVTSSVVGVARDDQRVRQELMSLIYGREAGIG